MINYDKKSINTKKIICLAIATSIAIITSLIIAFVPFNDVLYEVILCFLLAILVFIGYASSNILDVGLSACIFLFLGPILAIPINMFKNDISIDNVPFLLLELCYYGIYIITILISYLISSYFKNKSRTIDLVIQILLINLGIITSFSLYSFIRCFVLSMTFNDNYFTGLGDFIFGNLKYSPILILFVSLTLFISKLIFKKRVITTSINFNEKLVLDNLDNICRNCKTPLNPDSKFCTTCGTPIVSDTNTISNMDENETLCNNCKKVISVDAKFCIHCGNPKANKKLT
ncbi:zinc ribbon domain-containing protein [Clostridium sp. UBA5712]|uniref:zinc ribbon domain-containing protein n=1 Tax=Clostridium sp. UBA5712 TaxID=1946368 RepID=UPI003216AE26